MGEAIITNTFEVLCRDNVSLVKKGRTAYIYTYEVLERTQELLDNLRIDYITRKHYENNIFEYYCVFLNKRTKGSE